jgi:hypothetical protein
MNSEKHIGMDVHEATISAAMIDSRAKTIMESFRTTTTNNIAYQKIPCC